MFEFVHLNFELININKVPGMHLLPMKYLFYRETFKGCVFIKQ